MKILKILFLLSIFVYANEKSDIANKEYIKDLLNYNTNLSVVYNPFYEVEHKPDLKQEIKKKIKKRKKVNKKITKKVEKLKTLVLLAILNNKVLISMPEYSLKEWLKVGDRIDNYKILKIIDNNSILVSVKKQIKIVKLFKRQIQIKVK